MAIKDLFDFFDELDDEDSITAYLQFDAHRSRNPKGRLPKKLEAEERAFIAAQDTSRATFQFTYRAARFEEGWLLDSLGGFAEHQWISDVLGKVKGGKEASVYLCRAGNAVTAAHPGVTLVAAKVYRPRELRNLKNDHRYREGRADLDSEGRQIIDDGALHAIASRSAYGEELRHQSWIAYEYTTIATLHAAGADVPKPYTMANNAILMDFIGEAGMAAPALNDISLERDQARVLFDRAVRNLEIMLAHERVHGDLSAYNILFWDGEITLIDFPQVVSPKSNRNAWTIFQRDVERVCEYFAGQGVDCNPHRLARDLWTACGYPVREAVHPRDLNPDDPRDRRLWERR
ncbi:MAG: RIO1 family regulatory kinase/ATPase [Chloroflexota bacterium]